MNLLAHIWFSYRLYSNYLLDLESASKVNKIEFNAFQSIIVFELKYDISRFYVIMK